MLYKVSSPSSFTTFDLFSEPSFTIPPFNNSFSPCSSFIYPDEAFYIGDLLSPSTSLDSFTVTPTFHYIKLANVRSSKEMHSIAQQCTNASQQIPWDISQKDIRLFFKDFEFPSDSMHAQSIHVRVYLIVCLFYVSNPNRLL